MNLASRFLAPLRRPAAALATVAVLLGALAGCGGGSQADPFRPTRAFALGDEFSVLRADGRKFTVNALKADSTGIDCAANPLWTQIVFGAFGLTSVECNPNNVASPGAQTLATEGTQVAFQDGSTANTLAAQVDAVMAANPGEDALVTLLVGSNDILEQYGRYPGTPESELVAVLRARGRAAGELVNRMALAGPAVLVATVPDMGFTPFALNERATKPDTDRAALLSRLTDAFNAGLRLGVINDGRLIGVVFADQEVRDIVRVPGAYGFTNVTTAVCVVALPACTSAPADLVAGANPATYLWADGLRFAPGGHARLGLLGQIRAQSNPF